MGKGNTELQSRMLCQFYRKDNCCHRDDGADRSTDETGWGRISTYSLRKAKNNVVQKNEKSKLCFPRKLPHIEKTSN